MKIKVNEELRYSSDTSLKRKKRRKIIDRGILKLFKPVRVNFAFSIYIE